MKLKGQKYLLIDFWFSHCNPCISQFAELNKLFKEYNLKEFNIIGVSIDGKKDIPEWENMIRKHSLLCGQFLDLIGKVANKLGLINILQIFSLLKRERLLQEILNFLN